MSLSSRCDPSIPADTATRSGCNFIWTSNCGPLACLSIVRPDELGALHSLHQAFCWSATSIELSKCFEWVMLVTPWSHSTRQSDALPRFSRTSFPGYACPAFGVPDRRVDLRATCRVFLITTPQMLGPFRLISQVLLLYRIVLTSGTLSRQCML